MLIDSDELYNAIDSHVQSFKSKNFTALPAKVITYDNVTQTVTCRPVMYKSYIDGINQEYAKVVCPLIFPSSGGGSLTFPIKIGDEVLLIMSTKDFANWWNSGKDLSQSGAETFNRYNDAIAVVGLKSKNNSLNASRENVELTFEGEGLKTKLSFTPEGAAILSNEAGASVTLEGNGYISVKNNSCELLMTSDSISTTAATFSAKNSEVELVDAVSQLMGILEADSNLSSSTTAAITALKILLDTLKE